MDFYKRIEVVCGYIPYGRVATYGQIALLCGKPKHSRQVGYALNRKLEGVQLPAHRVVNHQGFLSGAGSFETPDRQKSLLMEEGVVVSGEQRVDLKKYGWKNSMDDALFLQEVFKNQNI